LTSFGWLPTPDAETVRLCDFLFANTFTSTSANSSVCVFFHLTTQDRNSSRFRGSFSPSQDEKWVVDGGRGDTEVEKKGCLSIECSRHVLNRTEFRSCLHNFLAALRACWSSPPCKHLSGKTSTHLPLFCITGIGKAVDGTI
jgi:hypothetical protein